MSITSFTYMKLHGKIFASNRLKSQSDDSREHNTFLPALKPPFPQIPTCCNSCACSTINNQFHCSGKPIAHGCFWRKFILPSKFQHRGHHNHIPGWVWHPRNMALLHKVPKSFYKGLMGPDLEQPPRRWCSARQSQMDWSPKNANDEMVMIHLQSHISLRRMNSGRQ